MSTIAGLISQMNPTIRPWAQGQREVADARRAETLGQTNLLELADLKRKQEAEALLLERIKNDPELRAALFGGSTLAGLPTTGAPPAVPPGGALTQQAFGPTGAPGPAQVVPGGQDLSRFAGVSPQGGGPIPPGVMGQVMPQAQPPQSVLGSLGPAGQPQMQAPQNPLLEMARTNPRAAMMLQGQMQQSQDRQWKMQEQQLSMGVKVAEFVARELQGVTDQASLDAARERIRQVHPQAASQVPQMYSQEAVASVQQRGIAIAERATTQLAEAKARNLDMETRMFPELAQRFGMGGDAPAPAGEAAQPSAGTPARTAPPEFERAITDANRLYPQVSTTRITSMIAAESNFDAKAVSSAGAQGAMQLMPGTAKDMGVDDPLNVEQNVRGGTRYYAQMLAKYGGDERKALTAYNWGPKNLDDAGGDVTRAPAETKAYVAKVLGGGGGSTTGTAQAAATDPRIAGLDAKIAQRTREAQIASLMKNESLSTRLNDDANRLTAEKNRLIEESRRQQERREEIPRAVEKERVLTEQKQTLERQRQEGPLLPEESRKLLRDIRADIRSEPTHKLYQDVRSGYQNVRIGAASDSSQGDLAIINGMAKILDPSGTVMTGEAENIQAAQGQLQVWFNSPARFFEGDRLTPENRQRFLRMAHELAKEKLTTAQTELRAVYEPLAKKAGLDFGQILPLEDLKPIGPGPNVSKFEKLLQKK